MKRINGSPLYRGKVALSMGNGLGDRSVHLLVWMVESKSHSKRSQGPAVYAEPKRLQRRNNQGSVVMENNSLGSKSTWQFAYTQKFSRLKANLKGGTGEGRGAHIHCV